MQIIISKLAYLSEPNIPDPTEYGRHIDNDIILDICHSELPHPLIRTFIKNSNINVATNVYILTMDESEDLHMDQTNVCFTTREAEGEGWDPVKLHVA